MGAKKLFTLISLSAIFYNHGCKDMEPWNEADRTPGSKFRFKPEEQMNYEHVPAPVSYEQTLGWAEHSTHRTQILCECNFTWKGGPFQSCTSYTALDEAPWCGSYFSHHWDKEAT